jgi:hypothetical protein
MIRTVITKLPQELTAVHDLVQAPISSGRYNLTMKTSKIFSKIRVVLRSVGDRSVRNGNFRLLMRSNILRFLPLLPLALAWVVRDARFPLPPRLRPNMQSQATREQAETRQKYNMLIYDAGERGHWPRCLELLEELQNEALSERAAAPNEYTLNALLVGAVNPASRGGRSVASRAQTSRDDHTEQTFRLDDGSVRSRVAAVWQRLVEQRGRSGQTNADGASTRQRSASGGVGALPYVVPDRVSLNTALKQWFPASPSGIAGGSSSSSSNGSNRARNRRLIEAKAFVADVCTRYKVTPDVTTFNSLIRIAAGVALEEEDKARAMTSVEDIVAHLEAEAQPALRPTVVTYTTLIVGYAQCAAVVRSNGGNGSNRTPAEDLLRKAEQVFYDRMPLAGILPNAVTVSALANGLLAAGRSREASELLNAAADQDDAYAPCRPPKGTRQDGNALPEGTRVPEVKVVNLSAVQPDRSFFNTAMNVHRALGDVDGVMELLQLMHYGESPAMDNDGSEVGATLMATQKHDTTEMNSGKRKQQKKRTKKEPGQYQVWRDYGSGADTKSSNGERRLQWNAMTEDEQRQAAEAAAKRRTLGEQEKEDGKDKMLLVTSIGVGIDAVSVHTAIAACCDAGRISDALDLALDVAALPHPSAEAFNPIIHALALGDSAESPSHKPSSGHSVGSALLETIADGIYEDERWSPPALSLTEGPGANSGSPGGLERAWGLFQEMRCGRRVLPDACSLQVLMEAHLRKGEPVCSLVAWHLFVSYSDSAGVELEATLNTAACNAKLKALAAFLYKGEQQKSRTSVPLRGEGKHDFDFVAAARAAAREETASREAVLRTMLELVQRMVGQQPTARGDAVGSTGSAFRHDYTCPDTQTLNAALDVCAAASSAQEAAVAADYTREVLALLLPSPTTVAAFHERTRAVHRDAATARQLIKGASRRGSLTEAFRVAAAECVHLHDMPDRTYSALLSACIFTGDVDEAVALLERGGFVRLSSTESTSLEGLSSLLPIVPFRSEEIDANAAPEAASLRVLYFPTLLRLLQALTAKSSKDRPFEVNRLARAVDILVSQCPGRDTTAFNANGSASGVAVLDAYIIVAEACLRLGGQPDLLRRVITAAHRVGIQLENRMVLSNDLHGFLVGEDGSKAPLGAETVVWGSRAAAGTVAASVSGRLGRLGRAIKASKKTNGMSGESS